MKELSLFSGAGGGCLGGKLLGWTTIGYVEYDNYCQKILKQRIEDGFLDAAPIFGDIRSFVSDGYADAYQGMVDVVSGGFPCQPFSAAGKKRGGDDPRNMWPATIEVIRRVKPRYVFLENVRGLLTTDYFGQILKELAETGYDVRWCLLGADDCGAPQHRKRLWILAYPAGEQDIRVQLEGVWTDPYATTEWHGKTTWFDSEPDVGRVVNGVANGMDRLKALGNGQVPAVVRAAWHILTGDR